MQYSNLSVTLSLNTDHLHTWCLLDILLSVVRCCVTNCHSTECLAPCGAVAAFLQCALYMLLVLRPCTFSCRFCLVLLLVHGDFRVDFHVCSHCTVSYRFWLTLRTLCTWTRTRVLRSTLTLSCSSFDDVVFTLMFVLTVSWFVLLPDGLSYYVLFGTPHSCCHVCHLYFGLVYLFFVGVLYLLLLLLK